MTRTIRLSKSKIINGLQCSRRLWLEVHRPGLAVYDAATLQGFAGGHRVGAVARGLYAGGVLVEAQRNLSEAVRLTAVLLAGSRDAVVYEGAFRHADVLVRADVVERVSGRLRLIEVKSATRVKPYHLDDAAVQAWVVAGAGYRVDAVSVAHIDTAWVYPGGGDYGGLLREVDVTAEVRARAAGMPQLVRGFQRAVAGPAPLRGVGPHCRDPFVCPYVAFCEAASSETLAPPAEQPEEPVAVSSARVATPGPPVAQAFLDVGVVNPAIPVWPGTRPYEGVPVQWSCHFRRAPGAVLEHAEYLAAGAEPPFRAVAESLLATLAGTLRGQAIACDVRRVGAQLGELADRLPDLADDLRGAAVRLVDCPTVSNAGDSAVGESPQEAYLGLLALTVPGAVGGLPAAENASQLTLGDSEPEAEPRAAALRRLLLDDAAQHTHTMAAGGGRPA